MSVRLRARVVFAAGVEETVRRPVSDCLEAAGVRIVDGSTDTRGSADIVVTPCLGEETLSLVRTASRGGARRALVVVTTEVGDDGGAVWRLLRAGADDVLPWEERNRELSAACVAARLRRWREVDDFVDAPPIRERLVGRSPAWVAALRELVEVARLSDAPVLITGESGTGKELAARLLHDLDPRPGKRELVIVDCTTIVPTLAGSEFFGHERGAFTDAVVSREGAFAEANGGTLFLDELGDLPLGLQGELLRVIQEGTYKRVGSGVWKQTRFRLICATNRDLREEVAKGQFRSDLYHRVAAWTVHLPSLRERPQDVPVLADHLLHQLHPEQETPSFHPAVLGVLQRREYPGNVRELRLLVARLAARHVELGPITVGDLPPDERPGEEADDGDWRGSEFERCVRRGLARNLSLRAIRCGVEEIAIAVALQESGNNLKRASARLQISKRWLEMLLRAALRNGTYQTSPWGEHRRRPGIPDGAGALGAPQAPGGRRPRVQSHG
jgi:DNA-binding NtrC family response regulator